MQRPLGYFVVKARPAEPFLVDTRTEFPRISHNSKRRRSESNNARNCMHIWSTRCYQTENNNHPLRIMTQSAARLTMVSIKWAICALFDCSNVHSQSDQFIIIYSFPKGVGRRWEHGTVSQLELPKLRSRLVCLINLLTTLSIDWFHYRREILSSLMSRCITDKRYFLRSGVAGEAIVFLKFEWPVLEVSAAFKYWGRCRSEVWLVLNSLC
jgi:hypothetical protein